MQRSTSQLSAHFSVLVMHAPSNIIVCKMNIVDRLRDACAAGTKHSRDDCVATWLSRGTGRCSRVRGARHVSD